MAEVRQEEVVEPREWITCTIALQANPELAASRRARSWIVDSVNAEFVSRMQDPLLAAIGYLSGKCFDDAAKEISSAPTDMMGFWCYPTSVGRVTSAPD